MKKTIMFCLLLLVSDLAYSGSCYVAKGKISGIGKGGELNPCQGKVEKKPAQICFVNEVEQPICKDVDKDFKFSEWVKEKKEKSFLQVLYAMYNPGTDSYYGGKRFAESESLPGFPDGTILLPHQSLVFSTDAKIQKGLGAFKLYKVDGNRLIYESTDIGKKVSIPAGKLSANTKYRWLTTGGKKGYGGSFTTAFSEDQQEFEAELKKSYSLSDLSEGTRQILRAILAKQYGYQFDMQKAIIEGQKKLGR